MALKKSAQAKNAHIKSIIHMVTSLRTNEGLTLPYKGKSVWTKLLGKVLNMCVNEKTYQWVGIKNFQQVALYSIYTFFRKNDKLKHAGAILKILQNLL